jgi:predicted 3-demethylubiquinone-9 3-methyltransferase (glyoxalase superfamily)
MSKISPCLWFVDQAEEAVNYYVSLLPDSRIEHIARNVMDLPSGKTGSVLLVSFTLAGQRFLALNGGVPQAHSHAISFYIDCADQAEIDRLWEKLSDGGEPVQCGWVRDRYGVSWQVVPGMLPTMLRDVDTVRAQRVMQAMLKMVKLDIATLRAAYDGVGA